MQRIAVIGVCGAGKSTLSSALGSLTGLPVYYLDQLYWKPGWIESEKEEFRKRVASIADTDCWIMDGNYSSTFDLRFSRADTIIYLDFARHIALYRAVTRILKSYGRVRQDMTEGCPERFNFAFFKYIWNFHKLYRPRTETALATLRDDQKLFRLNTPKDVSKFLKFFVQSRHMN